MTRTKQFTAGLVTGASLLAFGAVPLSAGHFQELSADHTNYGVAQLNYVDVGQENSIILMNPNHVTQVAAALAYTEPTYLYSFGSFNNFYRLDFDFVEQGELPGKEDEETEVFLACVVVKLTPHGAVKVTMMGDPVGDLDVELYMEVIWSPEFPVRVPIAAQGGAKKSRRIADGLGGRTLAHAEVRGGRPAVPGSDHLAHPGLFTPPDDSVDYVFDGPKFADLFTPRNQQEAARECICQGLIDLVDEPFNNLTQPLRVFEPFGINCV